MSLAQESAAGGVAPRQLSYDALQPPGGPRIAPLRARNKLHAPSTGERPHRGGARAISERARNREEVERRSVPAPSAPATVGNEGWCYDQPEC